MVVSLEIITMKTYFNTFQFKNEATLNVTTTATLKEDTYIFNFDIEVFDHNSLSSSELERVFYSTFSQEFKEDKVFIQLNKELAQHWPLISESKEPLVDADKWNGVEDKLRWLEQ